MNFPGPGGRSDDNEPKCHRPPPADDDASIYSNQSSVMDHGLQLSGAEEFLASRPSGETLDASIRYVIEHPRENWNMMEYLSKGVNCHEEEQNRCQATIDNYGNMALNDRKILMDAEIKHLQKKSELAHFQEEFNKMNDALTAIKEDLSHLEESMEKSRHSIKVADMQVKSARFSLALSRSIVLSLDTDKPFATSALTLEEVRSRMGLEDTSKVALMSANAVLRATKLLHNFGLQCNPNFRSSWKHERWSSVESYEKFQKVCGRDPCLSTGKKSDNMMRARLIGYLQIPGRWELQGIEEEEEEEEEDEDEDEVRLMAQMQKLKEKLGKLKRKRESSGDGYGVAKVEKHIDFSVNSPYGQRPPGRVARKHAARKEASDDEE